MKEDNILQAKEVLVTPTGTEFDLMVEGEKQGRVRSLMLGQAQCFKHAFLYRDMHAHGGKLEQDSTRDLDVQRPSPKAAMLWEKQEKVLLYDDFAHHPTAIRETISAFRPMAEARGGKLWAIFEPRSNTLRRKVFEKTLPESFLKADHVVLAPVYVKPDALTREDTPSNQKTVVKALLAKVCGCYACFEL